jgi:hypothetical protein
MRVNFCFYYFLSATLEWNENARRGARAKALSLSLISYYNFF